MLYGIDSEGNKLRATPNSPKCHCEICGEELIAKCGQIMRWHWSHKTKENCDSWSEGETEWHLGWKSVFPKDWVEIPKANHRADVVIGGSGRVLELQHSYISPAEIEEREKFYGKMVWLFDATEAKQRGRLTYRLDESEDACYLDYVRYRFHWKHMRKTILFCKKPILLDLGTHVMQIKQKRGNRGTCEILNIFDFAKKLGLRYEINQKTSQWEIEKFIDPLNFK